VLFRSRFVFSLVEIARDFGFRNSIISLRLLVAGQCIRILSPCRVIVLFCRISSAQGSEKKLCIAFEYIFH
jgi:hypothetical protein